MSLAPLARCRPRNSPSCLRGDDRLRARPRPVRRAQGDLAPPHPRLDLGCLMAAVAVSSFWIHQIRLLGPWSPIHLLSIFTLVMLPLGVWSGAPSRGRGSSPHHDLHFHRRAGRRRAVHAAAGADHARRRVRPLRAFAPERFSASARGPVPRPLPRAGFEAAARGAAGRVSLWKNEGKNRSRGPVKGGFGAPIRYMIRHEN